MLGSMDILLRLNAAMLIGGVVGLNRELHHKPTGLRTLSLVRIAKETTKHLERFVLPQ
jgi:putative Mg2+ transporter-C (MgtC) family protein